VQAEPRGTADALAAARGAVGNEPFLAVNGDNYYPVDAIAAVSGAASHAMGGFDPDSLVEGGNIPRDRLPRFAFAWADATGVVQRFIEKPEVSPIGDPDAKVSMNLWRFGPRIFDACDRVTPSVRGELELVDAVRLLPEAFGEPVSVVPVRGPVLDLSSRADIVAVEHLLASREVRL
jgi:dTDP-glucose pyrophosphorylase